ncbi:MAG TPA: EamA family transporter [Baekduia sp.]|uniref:EamA family transporter n=1 Tax=Baekduia sp. TaxID=2600305 RepID=UPI002D77B47B|nr:EamA family transporter [Baekduia sp.]HET6509703.1 EamA family transporter [Baekduia sp.]
MDDIPPKAAIGYALALGGSMLSGLNGSIGRYLTDDGLSPWRLTELRSAIAFGALAVAVAAWRPRLLAIGRGHFGAMLAMALAMTTAQAGYFYATTRMAIGVALVVQYLYPLLILLWLTAAHGRRLAPSLWAAMAVCLVGSLLAVGAIGGHVDAVGVLASVVSATAFAVYIVAAERAGDDHHPVTTTLWTFGIATLVWCVVQPVWTFPGHVLGHGHWALGVAVGTVGTLLPFASIAAAVRFAPAARIAVLLTAETVSGAAFAYILHGERLSAIQLAGGALVVAALCWVQLQPQDAVTEAVPRARRRG